VQEATRSTIEPLFDSIFVDTCFAYRPNRGPQKAICKVEQYIRQGKTWIATFDDDVFKVSVNFSGVVRRKKYYILIILLLLVIRQITRGGL
jgi:hypothetical protein